MREYMTDKIGTDYMQWNKTNIIQITAPTGSGKTHFVLHTLLPYAIVNNKSILYLVNRYALQKQIKQEVDNFFYEHSGDSDYASKESLIKVYTYQHIERLITDNPTNIPSIFAGPAQSNIPYEPLKPQKPQYLHLVPQDNLLAASYDYIIADEAHYFLLDSLFNTNTCLSYAYIMSRINRSTLIFISATMQYMSKIIKDDFLDFYRNLLMPNTVGADLSFECDVKRYEEITKTYVSDADYSYFDIKFFSNKADLTETIISTRSSEKWLIFLNNRKEAEELTHMLTDNGTRNEDIVFVDSDFKKDVDSNEEMRSVSEDQILKHRILISTSVLDNGVSIKDIELWNIAIFANTKEEFIQMIGRKRIPNDGSEKTAKVKLYVWKGSAAIFNKRLKYYERVRQCLVEINSEYTQPFSTVRPLDTNLNSPRCQLRLIQRMLSDATFYQYANQALLTCMLSYSVSINNYYRSQTPWLYTNYFSMLEVQNRIDFYKEQLNKFNADGEDAFFKTQCEWLGISPQDAKILVSADRDVRIEEMKVSLVNKINTLFKDSSKITWKKEENVRFFKGDDLFSNICDELAHLDSIEDNDLKELDKLHNASHRGALDKQAAVTDILFNTVMRLLNLDSEFTMKKEVHRGNGERDNYILRKLK